MAHNGWWSGRRRVVAAIVVVVAVVLAVIVTQRRRAQSAAGALRRVQVTRQDLRITKTATGEVTPQNRVEVKPPIAGRVEEVLVHEGDAVTKGQVVAWMSSAERAALLDAARAEGAEALARWEAAYKPAPLIAPLDGTVIVRAVEPGQTVATNDPVVVVADRLIVKAQVDETDIGAVAVNQQALINLDAYPQERIPARVDHVAYEAKTVNNVTIYEVDVLPTQVPPFMRSGMTANVTIVVDTKPGVLVLPSEAVKQDGAGASVQVPVRGLGRHPERQDVSIGLTDGKYVEIVSGLQAGDAVLAPSLRLPHGNGQARRNPFSPMGGGRPGGGRKP